ncbi:DUF551 domain-containing protein [Klebsiella pneumoniae]|uniref:DUF551 domain-containing protein n=1 Tax=Klebsiella pneumoniae TaxID=573 RepID=UPI000DE65C3C|nr:DUF551 domain-containing protein [Klebsiella pneumoniae]SSG63165.1 Eaa1 [Klebsiella pneumoniae]HBT0596789.1 DUF551 domain-containing protein [Klebsiella pneumoniae]HBX6129361.1 DUF551 domain-containing protein [Klebsiella pneumoniae]
MTKSTITRGRIEQYANDPRMCNINDEIRELARMALAAMDSEPVELPLDYLQGHKYGLEWAAQLAEANHPETGDWLYDDPIELAKAIRKGQDMPPVQPVADSEKDRNPVLAYADSYRDMAKQGVESVPIWSVITDLERNIAPLYRHAQPAPAVPDAYVRDERGRMMLNGVCEPKIGFGIGWNACRAAMLAAAPQSPGSDPATVPGKWIPVSERMPEVGDIVLTAMGGVVNVGETECSAANCRFFTSVISGRELPATHWMPLPAAPQEVSDA